MSIIIIDGSKLRRIKKIEKFLESSYKYYKGEENLGYVVTGSRNVSNNVSNSQIETLSSPPSLSEVQNNPETLNQVKDMLKQEGYISVLRADTKHNVCVEEVVSADKIFKKG